jgi:hypothetical protein
VYLSHVQVAYGAILLAASVLVRLMTLGELQKHIEFIRLKQVSNVTVLI